MSISHRTNRLKLIGSPSVEKLQNGRYKLVVTCSTMNSREDWYSANKARIFPDFGSLQSAEMSIDGLAPRTGEAYADMRLTQVESGNRSGMGQVGDYNVSLTYETLGSSFIQVKDDDTDYELNGLRRVRRTSIAEAGTDYAKTVGTSFIDHQIDAETAVRCFLASYAIDDTDSFRQVQEVWLESGTLSETLDNVGSQKAKVIETIGADPATPTGYSLASKQESDFEGFQTNRFTFLKNNVELSRSEDKVGSQLAITTEVFKPASDPTESGYSVARTEVSDVDGIPTKRFTFLKDNVELIRSNDYVGSQLSITREFFNPTSDPTESGYSLASQQQSDFEGIKTIRYVFLKDDVKLSASEDEVGSQKAITEQWFKPGASRDTKGSYSLARKEESDVEGIPTERYTFLKDNVVLSVSEDKVGSQKAVVNEVFNPTSEAITGIDTSGTALVGYSEANRTESDYEGIKTIRVQFLKPSILSLQQDFNNGLKGVSVQAFGMTATEVSTELAAITTNHELMSQTESDFGGIKTSTFQYQVDETFTEDYELNGLKRISLIELGTTNFTAQDIGVESQTAPTNGLYLGTQKIDNGGTIKVRESVWRAAGQISISEESGPQGIPNTKVRRYTSQVTEPTSLGIALSRNKENTSGYTIYNYSFLEGGTVGSSPVTGTGEVISYDKNIQVRLAGVVSRDATSVTGGAISSLNVVPPSVKDVRATISIKLVTTNTISLPVAYNLSGTSCAASLLTTRITPIGIEQGSSITAAVHNRSYSANARSFPNSYHTGGGTSSVETPAQIIRDDDSIIGESLKEITTTSVSMSGSTTAPATTGVYQDEVDPAFLDADGTQYYRRTTYTI